MELQTYGKKAALSQQPAARVISSPVFFSVACIWELLLIESIHSFTSSCSHFMRHSTHDQEKNKNKSAAAPVCSGVAEFILILPKTSYSEKKETIAIHFYRSHISVSCTHKRSPADALSFSCMAHSFSFAIFFPTGFLLFFLILVFTLFSVLKLQAILQLLLFCSYIILGLRPLRIKRDTHTTCFSLCLCKLFFSSAHCTLSE